MSRQPKLELLVLLTAGAMAALALFAGIQLSENEAEAKVDDRPRSPSGRCPNCRAFVRKGAVGDRFDCARCGAHLFQEASESVVMEG